MMERFARTLGFVLALLVGVAAIAQPRPPKAEKEPLTLDGTLAKLHAAYRTGPIGERVQIKVSSDAGPDRRATVSMLARRGGERDGKPDAVQLKLELGPLTVGVRGTAFTAINRLDRGTMFEADLKPALTPAALAAVLPPVPLPELELVFGADERLVNPLPFARDIRWSSAEPAQDAGRAVVTLKGQGSDVRATLTIDATTWRLRRGTFEFDADAQGKPRVRKVELIVGTIDPGQPARWEIPTAGRRAVSSLDELVPKRASLRPGDAMKDLALMDAELASFRWDEIADKVGSKEGTLALIVFRLEADVPPKPESSPQTGPPAGVVESAGALGVRAARAEGLAVAGVAFVGLEELDPDRLAELSARWSRLGGGPLLWTSSRVLSVEREGKPVSAAVVVVRAGVVRAVVDLDSRDADEAAVRRAVRAGLEGP